MNKLNGIAGRLSRPSTLVPCASSSVIFESNGFVECGGGGDDLIFGTVPRGGESVSGPVEPVFSHFHLLDFGGRCSGGLWWTEVIWEICDCCVSIRSEMVSSLSRVFPIVGTSSGAFGSEADPVLATEVDSWDSVVGGWAVEDGDDCAGDVVVIVGTEVLGLFWAATRFSCEIFRNLVISFRTGWSEPSWSRPSSFRISASSRSRLRSAIFRKII